MANYPLTHNLTMPTLLRSLSLFLLFIVTLANSSFSAAEETPWYEVEIIVFANAKGSYINSEGWGQDLEQPQFATARAVTPGSGARPFQAIDASRLRLQGEWSRLQNSGEYRPLLHMGWLQPGLERDKAVGVLVEAGAPSPAFGGEKPLSGVIAVGLSRYLHLDTNLLYRRAATSGAASFHTFQLKETRRMRSKEIHYLDHPMFGVIALITPIEGRGSR